MPLYEFYCSECHSIFTFHSRRVNTDKRPVCPRCGNPELERQVSSFAVSAGRKEEPLDGIPDLDGDRMEKVMTALAGEMAGVDESDPRQMARFMRRISEVSGLDLGSAVEEAIRRLEAGEGLEKIEEDMGGLLDGERPFGRESARRVQRRLIPPERDETLYVLE
ncbi:MAG: zinc ribbon domain-containing protein [Geobacteraceae bacterium]|nr:zinc ribbon domain-containing protein [Geobacteraceae bacterium]